MDSSTCPLVGVVHRSVAGQRDGYGLVIQQWRGWAYLNGVGRGKSGALWDGVDA